MPSATSDESASDGRPRVVRIDREAALDGLVDDLLDADRRRPVVVVSVPSDRDEPFIDAAAVAREADGQADVCVVPTGPLTFRMADALGSMACVYGGAGRVYAPGTAWLDDPFSSKLRFARDATEGKRSTEELVGDVLGALFTGTATPGALAGPVVASVAAAPAPATADPGSDVAALRLQVQQLTDENTLLEAQRTDYLTKIRSLQTEVERLRTRVREAKAKGHRQTVTSPEGPRFADPLEQLRWDIECTWVDRVHPTDKPDHPLRPYAVGPSFLDSLERLEGVSRDRVLSVVVDVLVGRPPGDIHPLRRSVGADDRPVTRGDAVCMRAPLQTGTPSARRLHYWKGPDGDIELSRVVLHDDLDP